MSNGTKHLKNKQGLWGWVYGGRYGVERYAYLLHRLTGLGLLAYFIMHIYVTGSRIGGQEKWESAMKLFESPLFKFGEFLVFLAFAYHALNGLRLGITELGYMIGKPTRPIYPYRTSILHQRPLLVVIMIVAAIVMIAGGADFYFLGH